MLFVIEPVYIKLISVLLKVGIVILPVGVVHSHYRRRNTRCVEEILKCVAELRCISEHVSVVLYNYLRVIINLQLFGYAERRKYHQKCRQNKRHIEYEH